MNRHTKTAMLAAAMLSVGASGGVVRPMPLARDDKPRRRQPMYGGYYGEVGYYGIPYPGLRHVSRETLNRKPTNPFDDNLRTFLKRLERRARRKRRMRLWAKRGRR